MGPDSGLAPDEVIYGDPPGWWYCPEDIWSPNVPGWISNGKGENNGYE